MTDTRPVIMIDCRTGSAKGDPFGRASQWAAEDGPEWLARTADDIESEYGNSVILGINQPAGKLPGNLVTSEQWRTIDFERRRVLQRLLRWRAWHDRSTVVYIGGRINPNWMHADMTTNGPMDLLSLSNMTPFGGLLTSGATHMAFDFVSNVSRRMDPEDRTPNDVRTAFVEFADNMAEMYGVTCIGEAIPNENGKLMERLTNLVPWMATLSHLEVNDPNRLWEAHGKQLYVGVRPGEDNRNTKDPKREYNADDLRDRLDRGFIPWVFTTSLGGFKRWRGVIDAYLHREVV